MKLKLKSIITLILSLALFTGFLSGCSGSGISHNDHTHVPGPGYIANYVAPTCTEDGNYDLIRYCTICNDIYSNEKVVVPALGHTAGEVEVENVVTPTCTEDGHHDDVIYCERCGEELSRETYIDPKHHTEAEAVKENIVEPTCTEKGHYDEVIYCEECHEELHRSTITTSALGHSWDEGVIVKEATLYEDGLKVYTCIRDPSHKKEEIIPMIETAYKITVIDLLYDEVTDVIRVASDGKYELEEVEKGGYEFVGYFDENGLPFEMSGTVDKDLTIYISYKLANTDTVEKLEKAAKDHAKEIVISEDIVIDRPIYFSSVCTLTASKDVTLLRDENYDGDLFVVGVDEDGNEPILEGLKPELTLGSVTGTSGKITLDGNKENVKVDVKGSLLFITQNGIVNFYNEASLVNNYKVSNERVFNDYVRFGAPYKVGGSAVTICRGSVFNMQGGLIDNCSINMSNTGGDSSSEDYMNSSRGGAIFNGGYFLMEGGVISNCTGYYGGVMYQGGIAQIRKGDFISNHAYHAGAIYSSGTSSADLYIGPSSLDETGIFVNFNENTSISKAGVIYASVQSPIIIHNASFYKNESQGNGGAIVSSGPLTTRHCIFDGNKSGYAGGAVYHYYASANYIVHYFEATDTIFRNNEGEKGGAVMVGASSSIEDMGTNASFTNCTFENNHAYKVTTEKVDNTDPDNPVITTSTSGGPGGAIYITKNSIVNVDSCTFTENKADTMSGCINSTDGGTLNIKNSTFTGNIAATTGGAMTIYGGSKLTIEDSEFNNNVSGENGGALALTGIELTLKNVNFTGNVGNSGGAIYSKDNSVLTLIKANFVDNEANNSGMGGAIYFKTSTLIIAPENEGDVLFNSNKAKYGGAIASGGGAIFLATNVHFIENSATLRGGAIYQFSENKASITNSIFEDNTCASEGGAIYVYKNCAIELGYIEFNNNTGGVGGAIYGGVSADLLVTKVSFIGNTANKEEEGKGGAIYFDSSSYMLINDSEFDANSSTYSSGGAVASTSGTVELTGTNTFTNNVAKTYGGAIHGSSSIILVPTGTIFDTNKAKSNAGGAIYITKGTGSVIDGATFTNNTAGSYGGALYLHNSTLEISNCTIGEEDKANTASGGGAAYISTNAKITFNNCSIDYNTAKNGGALYLNNGSELNINDCSLDHNEATSGEGGAIYFNNANGAVLNISSSTDENVSISNNRAKTTGGAIYASVNSTLNIEKVDFNNNNASSAGAIYVEGATLDVSSCSFNENNATSSGGAIYAFPFTDSESVKTVSNVNVLTSEFKNNNANSNGGAICMNSGALNIDSSLFKENNSNATSYGGAALYLSGVTALVKDSIAKDNTAIKAYGGFAAIYSGTDITLENSLFDGNSANYGGVIYNSKSTIHSNYSQFTNNHAVMETNVSIDDTDPENPVEVETYNAGLGGVFYIGNLASLYVDKAENIDSTFINNDANMGGVIYGTYYQVIDIKNSSFSENDALADTKLDESGLGGVIYLLKGQNDATVNVLNSSFGFNTASSGGAIYLKETTVTINTSTFNSNSSSTNSGGAIALLNSNLNVIGDSIFTSNTAKTYGGAIHGNESVITINNGHTSFDGNTATGNTGGAIYITKGTNSLFSGAEFINNSAGSYGGALYIHNSTNVVIENCTIGKLNNGNTAKTGGGAIYISTNARVIIRTSDISYNTSKNGGAIYLNNGKELSIYGSNISNNSATAGNGGAIYMSNTGGATLSINKDETSNIISTLSTNTASANGGAIYLTEATVTNISNASLSENSAASGGAVYLSTGATLNNSEGATYESNTSTGGGGAIYLDGATLTGTGSYINNSANNGGAIYATNASNITLAGTNENNALFSGNTATSNGGSLYLYKASGDLTFDYVTFVDGNASSAGVAYVHTSSPKFTNCTFGLADHGNRATNGGGVFLMAAKSHLYLEGCSATANHGNYGGVIAFYSTSGTDQCDVTIKNMVVGSNTAGTNARRFISCRATTAPIVIYTDYTQIEFEGSPLANEAALTAIINRYNTSCTEPTISPIPVE